MNDSTLPGVVTVLAVILAVELFTGTVGCGGNGGLSGAAFDLRRMEMKQRDILFSRCLRGQIGMDAFRNVGPNEDFGHKNEKAFFVQILHLRKNVLNGGTAGDEPMGAFAAFALAVVVEPVLKPLLLVLCFLQLMFDLRLLCSELCKHGFFLHIIDNLLEIE